MKRKKMSILYHQYNYVFLDKEFHVSALSLSCYMAYHITPHPTPVQGQGQISANFSASLEFTLLDIKSSYISATITVK